MKSSVWVGFAALAACTIVFSVYRMLPEYPSGRMPETRLVMEDETVFAPAGHMKKMTAVSGGCFPFPLPFAECLVEARQKGILDDLLDRMDPERRLCFHIVCDVSGHLKEVWAEAGREGGKMVERSMFVLGCYHRLRNECGDEARFFQWMHAALGAKRRPLLTGNVEYVFPWLQPDHEDCEWGHSENGSARINYTTYDCGPFSPEDVRNGSPEYLFRIVDHHADGKLVLVMMRSDWGKSYDVEIKTGSKGPEPFFGDAVDGIYFMEGMNFICVDPIFPERRGERFRHPEEDISVSVRVDPVIYGCMLPFIPESFRSPTMEEEREVSSDESALIQP